MIIKGIYLYFPQTQKNVSTGVYKKIMAQITALNNNCFNCELMYIEEIGGIKGAVLRRLPLTDALKKEDIRNLIKKAKEVDYIYIRKPSIITYNVMQLLKKIRIANAKINIIMEIPTYPYDKELTNKLKDFPFIIKERFNRNRVYKYIDRLVTFSKDNKIFNIETIKITNGIDLEKIMPRQPVLSIDDTINICAVAIVENWHGYDRVIVGIRNYYINGGKRKIIFHIVGKGSEVRKLEKLVSDFNLQKNVIIYGFKSGKELDDIYNKSDLAIEVLGGHRKGICISSSLKSREYLAKGIPIISSSKIDILQNVDFPYLKIVPDNDSPININDILKFYDEIYKGTSREFIVNQIRKFAIANCDINKTMQPIFNYLYCNREGE